MSLIKENSKSHVFLTCPKINYYVFWNPMLSYLTSSSSTYFLYTFGRPWFLRNIVSRKFYQLYLMDGIKVVDKDI